MEIENCFYRVSIKALILNETRDKFLICKERSGVWELPGGGLDWGATPQEDLPREIKEEMGIAVIKVADHPSYFITDQIPNYGVWIVNVVYETEIANLDFTTTDECTEIKFVDKGDIAHMDVFPKIRKMAHMFNPERHTKRFPLRSS